MPSKASRCKSNGTAWPSPSYSTRWRGSNQGNTFAWIGGKNQESGELLKRVDSSGILGVPKLSLDFDSDDIFPLRGSQTSFRNPQALRHSCFGGERAGFPRCRTGRRQPEVHLPSEAQSRSRAGPGVSPRWRSIGRTLPHRGDRGSKHSAITSIPPRLVLTK